jgi:hypothetical protein
MVPSGIFTRKAVMQRIGQDFVVKQSASVLKDGGITLELYELPNGQWQFGKGRDAKVVTSLEEVADFSEPVQKQVAEWLERRKNMPQAAPVIQGSVPQSGDVGSKLLQAIGLMDPEMKAKLLHSIESVLGPVADSLTQAAPVNSHGDGFGQDQFVPELAAQIQAFVLPQGARYVDPNNQDAGYLSPSGRTDDKGVPEMTWKPTPKYIRIQEGREEAITGFDAEALASLPDTAADQAEAAREINEELERASRELVGAGSGKSRRSRR